MEQTQLELQIRREIGSGEVKQLREAGILPGVVYGGDKQPVAVKLMKKEYERILRQHGDESVLFNVQLMDAGKKVQDFTALIKDRQIDPVSDMTVHLDFQRVSMDKEISVHVAVIIKGEAIGLKKAGATLEHMLREIEIICLPKDIPAHIEVDVTNLDTHQAIHVRELALPQGVRTKADPDSAVVAVVFSTREEVAATAEGEAAATPELEVIKEKPKDEKAEGVAGAKPAAGAKPEGGAAKK